MTRTMPQLQMDLATHKQLKCLEALDIDTKALFGRDLSNYCLEVVAVNNSAIKRLNHAHLGKNHTTDVLSFPLICEANAPFRQSLGSIVINTTLAKSVAKRLGHSFEVEASVLFIHGFLHILGFNHESDNGEQRAKEAQILDLLGLKTHTQGLIDRI